MKKILILEGSPRVHGNSNILSEQFAKGANEAGHETEITNLLLFHERTVKDNGRPHICIFQ